MRELLSLAHTTACRRANGGLCRPLHLGLVRNLWRFSGLLAGVTHIKLLQLRPSLEKV